MSEKELISALEEIAGYLDFGRQIPQSYPLWVAYTYKDESDVYLIIGWRYDSIEHVWQPITDRGFVMEGWSDKCRTYLTQDEAWKVVHANEG